MNRTKNSKKESPAKDPPAERKPVGKEVNWGFAEAEGVERRTFSLSELRVVSRDDGRPSIQGHAAVFNKLSEDLGGWQEKIAPGAFRQAIKNSDVRALFNHDPNFVLGRQSNDTLSIREDKEGLWMEVLPPDTQLIRDLVLEPIRRRDIREQSFGFIVAKDGDEWTGLEESSRSEKPPVRTVKKVARLFDVSPVTFPAYPATDVAVRSMNRALEQVKMKEVPADTDPVEEIILNAISNLESFKDEFSEKSEDEIREHFEQLVMNLVAFISPEVEFDSYEDLVERQVEEPVVEPTQDPDPEPVEDRTSVEPTQDGEGAGEGGEPTRPLVDLENDEKLNRVSILIRRFQDAPIE